MADTGISVAEAAKVLVAIQANGEINGVAAPALAIILAKAKKELEGS